MDKKIPAANILTPPEFPVEDPSTTPIQPYEKTKKRQRSLEDPRTLFEDWKRRTGKSAGNRVVRKPRQGRHQPETLRWIRLLIIEPIKITHFTIPELVALSVGCEKSAKKAINQDF